MAGIGVKLTNIYKKNTLTTDIIGAGYSMVVTIAPMLLVIGALMIMEYFLDFSSVGYVPVRFCIYLFFPCLRRLHLTLYYPNICQM